MSRPYYGVTHESETRSRYGVGVGDTLGRFELPGARTRSSTAEVALVMFAVGLLLGCVLGSAW